MFLITREWWVLVLRGVLAVLFGILAFSWPGVTLRVFIFLFGAYALVDGISSLIAGFRGGEDQSRWADIFGGLFSVLAGIIAFTMPAASAIFMAWVVAFWAIATGIAGIIGAIQLRKEITGEWMLALFSALSIILGVYVFARPGAGVLGLLWAIALYAILAGIVLVVAGFRARSFMKRREPLPT